MEQVLFQCYKIKITDQTKSVIKAPRRLPDTMMERLKVELDGLEKLSIVAKVNEPKKWASNLVIVEKPNKSLRICLDPAELNKVVQRDFCLIPKFDNIKQKLLNKKFFTLLDLKQGFWQIKLDNESADLCTFCTPFGYYKFNRLPFGISCAPEAFVKLIEKYFGNIDRDNIITYFDDILIATKTENRSGKNK